MYDTSLAERFKYLRQRFGKTVDDVHRGTGLSKSYLYQIENGEKENPTQDAIEAVAAFYSISPLFFSKKQENWVPPVPSATVQFALRTSGNLDAASQQMLEALIARTKALAAEKDK